MRRLLILVALAFMVGGGTAYVAAQGGTGSQTEETGIGADAGGCATPMASPDAEEITELLATVAASPEILEDFATAIASPGATPVLVDPCATPETGTPAA